MKERFRDDLHLSQDNYDRLMIINQIIEEYAKEGYRMTLRQLYYQLVTKNIIRNIEKEYAKLSDLLVKGRMCGIVDWTAIEDRIRRPFLPYWVDDIPDAINDTISQYRLNRQEGQEVYIEIWIEKDALSGVLRPITSHYHINLMVNRGYSSCTAMYDAFKRLKAAEDSGKETVILYLGDHDPSGLDMVRDVTDRLEEFGVNPSVHHVAITKAQIQKYNPPPNPAKALALTTSLATPDGWTTMEKIKVGDTLFADDGKICHVITKSDVFIGKKCYEFTFSCGEKIVSSEDHLWVVFARKRKGGIVTTSQIADSWNEGAIKRPVYRVPVSKPLDLPKLELPIPPYTLGVWLGDGFSEGYGFACSEKDNEILENIRNEGYKVTRYNKIRCGISGLCKTLRVLNLRMYKHIPDMYLRSSYEQRLSLLQGLMDTDGTVSDPNYRNAGICAFSSSRKALAKQVLELVCSLGLRGNISESRASINGRDVDATWRVEFYPGNNSIFRLKRKQERLKGAIVAIRQLWRTIIDVKEVESVPTQCIAVDSENHLFLAGKQLIPTHNTTDPRAKDYILEHGNTSWEVDALNPKTLNQLLRGMIESLIDMDLFNEMLKKENKDKEELSDLRDKMDGGGED